MRPLIAFVGAFTRLGRTDGFHVYSVDPSTWEMRLLQHVADLLDPAVTVVDARRHLLHVLSQVREFDGEPAGAVYTYDIDEVTGGLSKPRHAVVPGESPCYLAVDTQSRLAFTTQYYSGTVGVHRIAADGSVSRNVQVVQHSGRSLRNDHQRSAHPHCVAVSKDRRFALVADLGIDQIRTYRMDVVVGRLSAAPVSVHTTTPGAGPRHLVFDAAGRRLYSSNEFDNTIRVHDYDAASGALVEVQVVEGLDRGSPESMSSEIRLHPSGRWLYAAHRGSDMLTVLRVEAETGLLRDRVLVPSGGQSPRSFDFDPTGRQLVVANQDSDSLAVFDIDLVSGTPRLRTVQPDVLSPTSVSFLAPA